MAEEARLEAVDSGLLPVSPGGWFVVNTADAAWVRNEHFGGVCIFESDEIFLQGRPDLEAYEKPLAGFTIRVFSPGQPSGLYHAEAKQQEDFLVVMGECILLVDEQERHLRTWDFVHLPPGVAHAFVGAGDGPCVLIATGNRADDFEIVRPRSELALSYGAGVEEETTRFPGERYGPWPLERPESWDELPWSSESPRSG
jgi:mannose-6-phosphate isomerase-like protein (cupin superfamily)